MTQERLDTKNCRLIFDNAVCWRGESEAVRGVSLRVEKGQHWAIVGPNGCGKTSLILLAAGYLPLYSGGVFVAEGWRGEICMPELRKHIGLVSQQTSDHMAHWHPRLTGLETALSGRFGSLGLFELEIPIEIEAEARQTLADLGAGRLAEKQFGQMSTGERQICMIARSRMAGNKILLLDEPCAGLDIRAREELLRSVDAAAKMSGGPSILMVVHHTEEIVEGVADAALMKEGRIVAQGRKEEILTSERISDLFGMPVEVSSKNGRLWTTLS